MVAQFVKRCIDILGAIAILLFLCPVILFACMAIFFSMGRPIIFFHNRSGMHKQRFSIIKLRTMVDDRGQNLSDEERITPLGSFLRKYSIDELPQLLNVLVGNMSLVGPRPLLPEYDDHYSEFQNKRFLVKPGISG